MTPTLHDLAEQIDNDDCELCLGCGEIETENRTTNQRATVPCPECIAREIAVERQQHAAALRHAETEIAKYKKRGAHPVFDGEGKYPDQWHAWDDGYCQGLGIEDERHEVRSVPQRLLAEAAEKALRWIREIATFAKWAPSMAMFEQEMARIAQIADRAREGESEQTRPEDSARDRDFPRKVGR